MKRQIQLVHSLQYQPKLDGESAMWKIRQVEPTHVFVVPNNVYIVQFTACGGGAAGECVNLQAKLAGSGGAAGQVVKRVVQVQPGQRFEIRIGRGGSYRDPGNKQTLTALQLEQKVYEKKEPEDTIIVDCISAQTIVVARGGAGFSGGRSHAQCAAAESGIASLHNAGSGFCNASGRWIGYGGGGGGGRHGGSGGCVFSNCKTTRATDADPHTGCGGGGAALLISDAGAKHFLPGAGADGYVNVLYER